MILSCPAILPDCLRILVWKGARPRTESPYISHSRFRRPSAQILAKKPSAACPGGPSGLPKAVSGPSLSRILYMRRVKGSRKAPSLIFRITYCLYIFYQNNPFPFFHKGQKNACLSFWFGLRRASSRDVAQSGRALRSGRRDRAFKSRHPDHSELKGLLHGKPFFYAQCAAQKKESFPMKNSLFGTETRRRPTPQIASAMIDCGASRSAWIASQMHGELV